MSRKLKAVLATLLMVAAILVATEVPASAAWNDCPSGDVCIWDNANGTGFRYDFGSNVYGGCVNNGRFATTSSAANRRAGSKVKFYSAPNCFLLSGFTTTYQFNGANINFGFGLNDSVASFNWVPA